MGKTAGLAASAALVIALAAAVLWQWTAPPETKPAAPADADEDAVLSLPRGPAIAVLPFANMSGDPEQEYFADGLSEDILTGLSRFSQLRVIGRSTTFRHKGREVDVLELGKELGVRYVLEGSVRRSAQAIRVTAQLLDSTSGSHLWAETYDRDLTAGNVFAIQDDIREKVVAAIADSYGVITRTGLEEMRASGTQSLDAYDCVLRSYAYNAIHTPAAHLEARNCLERAVEIDPEYADAWAQLAYLSREEFHHEFNERSGALERALELARRAVELDPAKQSAQNALALAHSSRGEIDAFFDAAERAVALYPNDTRVLASMGSHIAYAGRWERGIALVNKAVALNPQHPGWLHVALFYGQYRRGRYEEALREAQKINMPELWESYAALAQAYGQLGRGQEAEAAVAALLELAPDIAANVRGELRKDNHSEEDITHLVDGLRRAGLSIPESKT